MRSGMRMLAALTTAAMCSTAGATTIVVDWAGGGSAETIQAGIDSAAVGDTVLVMPGVYSGAGNYYLDFGGKDCVLMSDGGSGSVTIDCGGLGRAITFQSGEGPECVVEGFSITEGSQAYGAAMYFIHSSPTIRDCVMSENSADNRGGALIFASTAFPTFYGCAFSGNSAPEGGALSCESASDPHFEECIFNSNWALNTAGAVRIDNSAPVFTSCSFDGNNVTESAADGGAAAILSGSEPSFVDCVFDRNGATGFGGAVDITGASDPSFQNCVFNSNQADQGGAASVRDESGPSFGSTRFSDNSAAHTGGAVMCYGESTPDFDGCTLVYNSASETGGAIHLESLSTAEITNSTFHGNSAPTGGGIWCDDSFELRNCIIAFCPSGAAVHCAGSTPTVWCCDVYGNAGGDWVDCLAELDQVNDNFSEDPIFCDAPAGDFTVDVASPCTSNNTPACGGVGAWDIGCDTPVRTESWGAMKAMYR
jgi:predicted outer membrane repeat protein